MAQIFISYSRSDRPFIDQLIPLIRRVYGNDSLWFDDDIHGGVDWWQMILTEVGNCHLFIYLISNESLESPYCQAELREALRLSKQILPVVVRRLKPSYPGNIEADLADFLRTTQYVDLSGGFRDPAAISALYAAAHRLLAAVPQQPVTPLTVMPTPEPPVPDRNQKRRRSPLLIGFGLIVVLGLVGLGLFLALPRGGVGEETTIPTSFVTTALVQVATDLSTESLTLSGFLQLQTAEAPRTQAVETQSALDLTATEVEILNANATGTATHVSITETAAFATLHALTAERQAFIPVTRNTDWTPHERDFDGVTMVLVPVGCFTIGSEDGNADEKNGNEVCFDKPFWIDKYEVTNAQYGSGSTITLCIDRSSESLQPRNCITWFEAHAFCAAHDTRLPTEAEWEYAARGPENWVYPWGNEFVSDNVIYAGNSDGKTAPVGSRIEGMSWVGALDISGNLWEWTSSLHENYPYDAEDGDAGVNTVVRRVLRGGAFLYTLHNLRLANRLGYNPNYEDISFGFRCARDFE